MTCTVSALLVVTAYNASAARLLPSGTRRMRHYDTSHKAAGSSPDEAIKFVLSDLTLPAEL
jgi:hypothetical protein